MGGKGSGRRKKVTLGDELRASAPYERFNWELAGMVAVICMLIFFGGYVLPNWYHDFEKEHYDKGYAAGTAQLNANVSHAFTQGIELGRLGYSVDISSYWYSLKTQTYRNETHFRKIDQNGDTVDEYGRYGRFVWANRTV